MRKYFSFFTAGGYELIYSYLNHILGVAGAFSGVQTLVARTLRVNVTILKF